MLCFRSCLKGDGDNNEYYEILGLPDKNVNQDAIKKAFKKASLNFHPDKLAQRGIEPTAENKLQFLKVSLVMIIVLEIFPHFTKTLNPRNSMTFKTIKCSLKKPMTSYLIQKEDVFTTI